MKNVVSAFERLVTGKDDTAAFIVGIDDIEQHIGSVLGDGKTTDFVDTDDVDF